MMALILNAQSLPVGRDSRSTGLQALCSRFSLVGRKTWNHSEWLQPHGCWYSLLLELPVMSAKGKQNTLFFMHFTLTTLTEKVHTPPIERTIYCNVSYLFQAALFLWCWNESSRNWRQGLFGSERIPQALLPHAVGISVVTVVAPWTTVVAIQTTPALQLATINIDKHQNTSRLKHWNFCRFRKVQEVQVSICRWTHRRVWATEPGTFWVSAAGSAIRTDVIVVTVDYTDWTLLLVWDVTVFELLKGRYR